MPCSRTHKCKLSNCTAMSYTEQFEKNINIPLNVEVEEPLVRIKDRIVLRPGSYFILDKNGHTIPDLDYDRVEVVRTDIRDFLTLRQGSIKINFNGDKNRIDIGYDGESDNHDLSHDETVEVNIDVDTDPFDTSVSGCNNNINLLTGSVAATEAAQVASINESSKQVASTIITGFFKNVQSEISTKILELSQRVESRLMHLHEQKKRLVALKEQLESEYQRVKARYTKTITDLNKELENRVKAIDEPIFKMSALVDKSNKRMLDTGSAEVSSIVASENSVLTSQILAASAKKRAQRTMTQALDFLSIQKQTDKAIKLGSITSVKAGDYEYYLPVCYFETTDRGNIVNQLCAYDKKQLPEQVVQGVADNVFLSNNTQTHSDLEQENVKKFFNAMMQNAYNNSNSEHNLRVTNTISKLFIG